MSNFQVLMPIFLWSIFSGLFTGTLLLIFETGINFWDSQLFSLGLFLSVLIGSWPMRWYYRRVLRKNKERLNKA